MPTNETPFELPLAADVDPLNFDPLPTEIDFEPTPLFFAAADEYLETAHNWIMHL